MSINSTNRKRYQPNDCFLIKETGEKYRVVEIAMLHYQCKDLLGIINSFLITDYDFIENQTEAISYSKYLEGISPQLSYDNIQKRSNVFENIEKFKEYCDSKRIQFKDINSLIWDIYTWYYWINRAKYLHDCTIPITNAISNLIENLKDQEITSMIDLDKYVIEELGNYIHE